MDITAPCSTEFRAAHNSGERTKPILWVVLHATEGGTARSVARYFATPKNDQTVGSANIVVDDQECYRTLDDDIVPWAAPGTNEQGWHVEQCGFTRWTLATWMLHRRTIRRAAYKAAIRCRDRHIPARWITAAEIRQGVRGVCTHADVTKAFPKLGAHTDPGPGYPRRYFMRQLRTYLEEVSL